MEIKVFCDCGTKLGFEAEPVDGRLPFTLTCPNCSADCTAAANQVIAEASVPSAPAPGLTVGLRVKQHVPPPEPPPSAQASDAASTGVPGLSFKHTPKVPEPEPAAATAAPATSEDETESVEARRTRRLAEAKAKQAEQNVMWAKVASIGRMVGFVVAVLLGAYFWYYFSGSKPKLYFATQLASGSYGATAELLGPDRLLVLDAKGVTLHDMKEDKVVWTVAAPGAPGGEARAADADEDDFPGSRFASFGGSGAYELHTTETDVWALLGGQLLQLDPVSGTEKKRIPVAGSLTSFQPAGDSLLVVTATGGTASQILRVNLASGEATTETATQAVTEKVAVPVAIDPNKPQTAGNLMANAELEEEGLSLAKQRSQFIAAGDHAVRLDVKLLAAKITQQKVMRDASTESKLNSKTSAASNPLALAEESFGELKRAGGGAYEEVDESTYEVAVLRLKGGEAGPPWTGQFTGVPGFFPAQTVDVVAGNQEVVILSKDNRELNRLRLPYPLGERGGLYWRRQEQPPCIEADGVLYLRDKGALTAIDPASGQKRWDFTTVGITSIRPDAKGAVYVSSTTADPDSIQFSGDVKMQNRPQAVLLKLDAQTGKLLWRGTQAGTDVYLSGKFVYGTRPAGSTLTLMAGQDSAPRTWFFRLNPRNGKSLWEYNHEGSVDQVDVFENRIMILNGEQVKVMKFLAL